MSAPAPIPALNAELKAWLFDHALPLWWEVGADHARGGFFERIDLSGRAVEGPRRVRVAARQTWVFAAAGRLGWTGPWREAVAHGVRALETYARPDGLYGVLADADGRLVDDTPSPYEQAFAMLALSAAQEAFGGDFEARAASLRQTILAAGIVRADGGVLEQDSLQANPMMHLFEAVQAWTRISGDPAWAALADVIARTALTRMIDAATGALCEQYAPDWTPRPDADVEPGHQLEWGWLLLAHGAGADAACRLIEIGETRGVERGVAIFSLDRALTPRDRSARLWAQTERLHAHAAAGRWGDIPPAVEGLRRYLDVPVPGAWRDRMLPDGFFVEEAAPASSLYHIVSAAAALDRACGGGG
ncbi:MAG: AGE family epimerase/isomerase [Caulobacter sp.]|nr:AGE family epimerase/isomerase [Caulobacter sp.]